MILLIDNYDSFTYNLVDLVQRHQPVKVIRNDEYALEEVLTWQVEKLLLSPGPGKPTQSGISTGVVQHFWAKIPILGVCLGHQLLAEIAGAKVIKANIPVHGKTSWISHQQKSLFKGLPNSFRVMRYHSLLIEKSSLPPEFEITAETEAGEIMAIQHRNLPITGVQFHPESILTEYGAEMMQNWLKIELR
ncbi:MAG: anthranilate synthase component II [Bacteroidia bacterium]